MIKSKLKKNNNKNVWTHQHVTDISHSNGNDKGKGCAPQRMSSKVYSQRGKGRKRSRQKYHQFHVQTMLWDSKPKSGATRNIVILHNKLACLIVIRGYKVKVKGMCTSKNELQSVLAVGTGRKGSRHCHVKRFGATWEWLDEWRF